jgi:Transglycosylase-like domain
MRRFMAIGAAVIGTAAVALPLTQAVASSGSTHPPHAERRNAANLKTASVDAVLANFAQEVALDHYLDDVARAESQAYLDALYASEHPVTRRSSGGGGGGGGGTCSGSIPGHIIYRESKCNPLAVNSRSGAAGKYQVLASTWDGYAGYATADAAPESVQDAWAAEAYAAAGCRPWGGC